MWCISFAFCKFREPALSEVAYLFNVIFVKDALELPVVLLRCGLIGILLCGITSLNPSRYDLNFYLHYTYGFYNFFVLCKFMSSFSLTLLNPAICYAQQEV